GPNLSLCRAVRRTEWAHCMAAESAEKQWRRGPSSRYTSKKWNGGSAPRSLFLVAGRRVLGPEQLLAVNLVIGDCLLAFVGNEPVDELLAKLLLHMRMLGRVNQDDTVLVEQQFVALHHDDEVGLVLERNPRAAVRHHIGSHGCCYVERGTHALPDRFVPRPSLLLDVDAGGLPEVEFGDMGARAVAARDEGCTLGLNALQRKGDVPCPLDAGGIVLRSDDDKIVIHHGIALH